MARSTVVDSVTGECRDRLQGRRVLGGNARHPPRAPPLAAKPRPRAQLGPVHAWTARTRAQRPLRSATMLAVRHWLGFGGRNTSEGAGTASSGGALGALADAASGGACLRAACAELADRVADQGSRYLHRRSQHARTETAALDLSPR
jgi:hypothetical protein